jgi:CHRD domain
VRLPRLALATSLVASLLLTIAIVGSVSAGDRSFAAPLTPGAEPDGGDANPTAAGAFEMTVDYGHRELCYELSWANLSAPATAAHIHVAPVGVAGPVVVPLTVTSATTGSTTGCVTVEQGLLHAIVKDPAAYYVNVHTSVNQPGAVRGQLSES